ELSYQYRFPVHACGYNWLDDNEVASKRLQACIEKVIARYQRDGRCDKVILVTHSMGGLVARHCSEKLGMRDKIMGIVHGVMPAIGAPALYRRIKSGTEFPNWNVLNTLTFVSGWATSEILGNDAAEMTAVLSGAPGPLQLLPSPEYGNAWFKVQEGKTDHLSLPLAGDPYTEIYTVRGKWWSLCEDTLINPLNKETDPIKRAADLDNEWLGFANIIRKQVKPFHQRIKGKYHPNSYAFYGCDSSTKAYGTVSWKSDGGKQVLSAAEVLNARADAGQIKEERRVYSADGARLNFKISQPDEDGDGTVPLRSGAAPQFYVKSLLKVTTEHEPAFRDCQDAQRFTLRAIVKISQEAKTIACLVYPE
ncbi:MAG: esterase/lipase family protein, partial [Shewanella oncorhynchi]